ncbi:MAG: type VI secretion system ImpA family N-terminal domain-containing protein [Rhodobacteraceae bacterium]|jgi:type VI secretion system protein ImpA|nr:type VI secretion system ImpA family N-terminal domain-containing protein [Paracoccaceae bacterium]
MALEWLLEPLSEAEPCGPNLDATDDADFVDYYFDAVGRLPERYVIPGMQIDKDRRTEDQVFDPRTVRIADENERLDALLRKSRDIRLLTLKAQWECLAGRIEPMAEAIAGIAALMETFPEAVHPQLAGGPADRREALMELTQPITIVTALQYIGLTGGGEVTLRKLKVAAGQAQPLTGEGDLSEPMMRDALASAGNRRRVDAAHGALVTMTDALNRISAASRRGPAPFQPAFDPTLGVLTEMREAITTARPDLKGAEADMSRAPVAESPVDTGGSASALHGAGPSAAGATPAAEPVPAAGAVPVASHAEARAVLAACEDYFRVQEPSSAALLLVVQARQLIGMPLIEAMEILLPEQTPRAVVSFGPQTGFALPFARLKALSAAGGGAASAQAEPAGAPPTVSPVASTAEAAAAMRGVEDFFRRCERSSPVPMLLQRARSYLDKDFQALVDELIPRAGPQS